MRALNRGRIAIVALMAGLMYAAGYAPRDWWWLTIVGVSAIYWLYALSRAAPQQPPWLAIWAAWTVAIGLTLRWIAEFSIPGWILASIVQGLIMTALLVVVDQAAQRVDLRAAGFVVAIVCAEWIRTRWPFGGVPLALISNSQVDAPFVGVARFGGALGLSVAGATVAVVVAHIATTRTVRQLTFGAAAAVLILTAGLTSGWTAVRSSSPQSTIRVAVVQGGGEIGTRARDTDPSLVFDAQIAATRQLNRDQDLDLILWPENALALSTPLAGSTELQQLVDLSDQYSAPISVGVTERANARQFRNAQILIDRDGEQARFEKVERVPFGEWIPFRNIISRLADLSAIPRDAIAGSGPGVFGPSTNVASQTVGMTISYEVYFAERARSSVNAGAQWLHVPTNASSYVSVDVTAATLNASRLQAISLDRDTVQVAPTGWSALIDSNGHVTWKTSRTEQAVYVSEIELRDSRTLYALLGDNGVVLAVVAVFGLTALSVRKWAKLRRRNLAQI